jgi:chemotaxis protein methyltransferase CheR
MTERSGDASQDDAQLASVLRRVREGAGLDLGPGQLAWARRVIAEHVREHRLDGLEAYLVLLAHDEGELERLSADLAIKETSFFRFPQQFHLLRERILPRLIHLRRRERTLRVWSAGCSLGAEPYSVAMVVRDVLADQLADWSVTIWATDLDPQAIATARRGCYGDYLLRGLPSAYRSRYVHQQGKQDCLDETIRSMVTFDVLNLVRPDRWPAMAPMDVILCRNVAIYFDAPTRRLLLSGLRSCLAPDGFLLLGHSELLFDMASLFRPEELDGVWVQRPALVEEAPVRPAPSASAPARDRPPMRASASPGRSQLSADRDPLAEAQTLIEQGRNAEALSLLGQSSQPAARALWLSAQACANLDRLPEATDLCKRALALDPLCAPVQRLEGLVALSQNDLAAAGRAFQRLIYLDCDDALAHYYLGVAYLRLKLPGRADRCFGNAERLLAPLPPDTPIGDTSAGLLRLACRRARQGMDPSA